MMLHEGRDDSTQGEQALVDVARLPGANVRRPGAANALRAAECAHK